MRNALLDSIYLRLSWRALPLMLLLATPCPAQDTSGLDRLRMFGSPQVVNSRLDAWENIARNGLTLDARASAVTRIGEPGIVWALQHEPGPVVVYPGIVARLRRVYPTVPPLVRGQIVQGLSIQAERPEAIAWLLELTKSDETTDGHIPIAAEAVEALARMGPQGEEALRRLHLSGAADPALQKMLDVLARTSYRRSPPRN